MTTAAPDDDIVDEQVMHNNVDILTSSCESQQCPPILRHLTSDHRGVSVVTPALHSQQSVTPVSDIFSS